ncbi:hypothetical protein PO124_27560 [Bacillus licheniformis]|nr:hypothetical protein [Bacillus licheniformis]
MMMLPIGTAIIHQVSAVIKSERKIMPQKRRNFKALIFSIGYAGTIGGLGTLIGTPPNIIWRPILRSCTELKCLSADGWLCRSGRRHLLVAVWLYLTKVAHPIKMKELPGGKN